MSVGLFKKSSPPPVDLDGIATLVAEKVLASGAFDPLPRDDFGQNGMYSPGVPFTPIGIDPREPDMARPGPRRSEFPTSVNLQLNQQARLIPFNVLRDVADRVDVIRRCIETRKSQVVGFDWDITLSKQAIKRVMLDNNIDSPGEAAQVARRVFADDIARLRAWWEKPDPINDMDFATWIGVMLEEMLVVDALSIYPRRRLSGEVAAFEILDGATIKPLLDRRGSTPQPPNPAYQQVLYGFPRGEFTSSDDQSDSWSADQLIYRPKIRRSFTPYGLPDTESALSSADMYLKRMAWIREEFTEGTTPDSWLKPPKESKMQPDQIRAWEAAMNAELAGITAERRKLRALPPGWDVEEMSDFADLYKPDLDELLIKLLCSAFSVMPTEIGFPPGSGIGGKGHQEGEANSSHRRAVKPTCTWVESVCTDISRRFLKMPPELQFTLIGWDIEDQEAAEKVADSQTRRGALTLNEDRASRGLPMYKFAEADTPYVVTGSGIVFLDGAIEAQAAAAGASSPVLGVGPPVADAAPPASATDPRPDDAPEAGDPIGDDEPVPDGFLRVAGHLRAKPTRAAAVDVAAEAVKFAKFAEGRHGRSWRPFTFEHIDPATAAELNDVGLSGDLALVKRMVADLGKAKARRLSRADKAKLIADHTPKIRAAVAALLPSPAALIDGWATRQDSTKNATTERHGAQAFVKEQLGLDPDQFDDIDTAITDYLTGVHHAAWDATGLDLEDLEAEADEEDDEEDDTPGHRSRLGRLIDTVSDMRSELIAGIVVGVAVALLSDNPAGNIDQVMVDRPEVFATTELTGAATAGALDAAQAAKVEYVRITATPECEFCAGYEGRILALDDDDGMPPLHNGCNCDVEPLDD